MANRVALNLFLFPFFFCVFFVRKDEILTKKNKMGKMKKKSSHSAVIKLFGRWTRNNIFLRVASAFERQ